MHDDNDPDVRMIMQRSRLYMIGQRAEAKFEDFGLIADTAKVAATYAVPGIGRSTFSVDFGAMMQRQGIAERSMDLELGAKLFRARVLDEAGETTNRIIGWFTTEKTLYDKWRGHPEIGGLDDYRAFATYQLLYVGMSQEQYSFARLVGGAHEARVRILSNETPLAPGARVTDEVFLFFFEVEPLRITVVERDSEIDGMFSGTIPRGPIIADAEKAFTRIVQSSYNAIRYNRYPRGEDGLYGEGLDGYGYVIDEDLTFTTETATIRGRRGVLEPPDKKDADMIFVEGDSVNLVRAEDLGDGSERS
jgi:hypothetical protein